MKKFLFLIAASLFISGTAMSQIQAKKATLGEDGRITVVDVLIDASMISNSREATELEGFPFGQPANPTFKNTRGATLADVDGDGNDEIIFGADKVLYCLKGDGSILWQRTLDGINILPPTVGDMNNDGQLEIAVNNAGLAALGAAGKVYLLNANGEDLPGWPVSFDDHWMMNAPAMADVNGDGNLEIITGERVSGSLGYIHILKMDGTELEGWPVETTGNVAFTPSIGDINNDGTMNIVSGLSGDGSLYAYDVDGNVLSGFPQMATDGKLSYQSVILADIDGDDHLEIIGSRHGDGAEYYAVKSDGTYADGWPVAAAGWTYSPPSVADTDGDGQYEIFMGNPNTDGSDDPQPMDVLFGFAPDGSDLDNFPISKLGGNEGVITIADINNDGVTDIIFTSNTFTIEDGKGFIHAFAMDGSGQLEGFPLRTPGWSYMNSAILGDIDGDGSLDLTSFSYTNTFGGSVDSVFITAFDLGYPYIPENIYFNAYKGSNVRDGLASGLVTSVPKRQVMPLAIYPNPASNEVRIILPENSHNANIEVFDIRGRKLINTKIGSEIGSAYVLNTSALKSGVYFVHIKVSDKNYLSKLVIE